MATAGKLERGGVDFTKVHTLMTHKKPHLDEICVWFMLRMKLGEASKIPGAVNLRFWDPEGVDKGKTLAQVANDPGILLCGIGGGALDEHPTNGQPEKDGECAATLAAAELGIIEIPELRKLLEYVAANDTRAVGSQFDLASGVRAIYASDPDPMVAVNWALKAIEAFYQEQLQFTTALNELRVGASSTEIYCHGQRLKIVSVVSDNSAILRASRFLEIAVLVQQNTSGNVQIYTNKKCNVPPLDDLARILRLTEQELRKEVITSDWNVLAQAGTVPGAPEWYYFRQGNMLLNGSLTAANTPTKILMERIVRAVVIALDVRSFEPGHFKDCQAGRCTASKRNYCPWYDFGLDRCRKIRHQSFKAKRAAEGSLKGGLTPVAE